MKFNRVSFEINKILAKEVIEPFLKQSPGAGQTVMFVGAAEVAEDATENLAFGDTGDAASQDERHHLLQVVPIRLTLE